MTDDNNFRLKYDVINDLSKLKDLYDNLLLENKNLKERLNKYTNPKSKKEYYQRNREKIIKQNSEYQKVYKSKNKSIYGFKMY
jgi:regulator of replication initiation timing